MTPAKALHRLIHLSLLLSATMVIARMIYSNEWYGTYLLWNLFLAWMPYGISLLVTHPRFEKGPGYILLLMLWLLFFPNAPYIITDLVHLKPRHSVPYWYDLLLLFWAAWNGLLLGFISLMRIERSLTTKLNYNWVVFTVYLSLVLCAFGVYAGRFLRWNSWHVITAPETIARDIRFIALNPENNLHTWAVTFLLSALMIIGYATLKQLQKIHS